MNSLFHLFIWFGVAWIAGTAAILGSLMAIASLLLYAVPSQKIALSPSRRPKADSIADLPRDWQSRLRLLGISVALAIAGLSVLALFPFPRL